VNRFIALDFETSGLDPKRHFPVSLGIAIFQDGEPIGASEWMIAPPTKDGRITREYDVCALEVSGTSWTKLKKEGMRPVEVLQEINRMIANNAGPMDTVVAFNASFDFSFWSELVFSAGSWNQHERRFEQFVTNIVGPWQCARSLAMYKLGGYALPKWNLDSVASYFGFSRESEKHGALEDAILAGRIYNALTEGQRNSTSNSTRESGELALAQEVPI